MKMNPKATRELLETISNTVIEHAAELTDLDRAIGDADHGINLERGFRAVLKKTEKISELPLGEALDQVGVTLILAVGGASGPLYGKLFATIGKQLVGVDPVTRQDVIAACEESIRVLKTLGRSDVGEKTMLDVLVPSLEQLRAGRGTEGLRQVRERARHAAQETVPMIARRGRASF